MNLAAECEVLFIFARALHSWLKEASQGGGDASEWPLWPPVYALLRAIQTKDWEMIQSLSRSEAPAIREAAYLAADILEPEEPAPFTLKPGADLWEATDQTAIRAAHAAGELDGYLKTD